MGNDRLQGLAGLPFRTRRPLVEPFGADDLDSLMSMMAGDPEMSFEHRAYGRVEVENLLLDHRLREHKRLAIRLDRNDL
jgi:hypothetical protein